MNSSLSTYLQECTEKPFVWGESDCATFCAEYVRRVTGLDITFGNRAFDKDHAEQVTSGDLISFASGTMEAAGFETTDTPMRGDIGIISIAGALTCAIKTSKGWAVKSRRGVAQIKSNHEIAWFIPVGDNA